MGIALHWRDEPFDFEFRDAEDGGVLTVFANGELVWEEIVRSAVTAYERAREVTEILLSRARQQA